MEELIINISYLGVEDEIVIITPQGYIDTTTVHLIEETLDEQLSKNKYKFIMDLKNTDYVNSSGWGVFMRDLKDIRDKNGDLVITNMSQEVYLVYETMDLSTVLKSFDTFEEALANFT
jgi:anti-anti-sigma factor